MSLDITVTLLVFGILLTVFSNYKARQDYEPGKLPLMPYNGLQFLGLIIMFVSIAHLISILTGKPFVGRMG